MTGSLIRKFIQVQTTNVDSCVNVKEFLNDSEALRKSDNGNYKNRMNLWKILLRLFKKKNPCTFPNGAAQSFDQKSLKKQAKVFPMSFQKCCETDSLETLMRIGHFSASHWLADICRIKPAQSGPVIVCSAFFLV